MTYKIATAHEKPDELVLINSSGPKNVWRVYFDTHEDPEAAYEEEVIIQEPVKVEEVGEDPEGNTFIYEKVVMVPKTETRTVHVFQSKYQDFTLRKGEIPTALDLMRDMKLKELNSYDSSFSVNSFILGGEKTWLDKDTRVGLMNSTSIQKEAGLKETTLWLGTTPLTLECDLVIQLLGAIEIYALACFNKTAEHRKNIESLETVEELAEYDYTVGYPEKIVINL